MMVIPSLDLHNAVSCMPLRKLFGWLAGWLAQTIQTKRISPSLRDKITQYQNECDDVLWKYWTRQNETGPAEVKPPKRIRMLMNMENGQLVSSQVVPDDALVFGLSEIPELIKEPGYFSVEDLAEVAKVANERLIELVRCKSSS